MVSWYDKYKPKRLADLVLPDDADFCSAVQDWVAQGILTERGLILYGKAGSGKTSFHDVLLKELKVPDMAIMRPPPGGANKTWLKHLYNEIPTMITGIGYISDTKYIIIDEIDTADNAIISDIRTLSDKYSHLNLCKFIFTTNDMKKIQAVAHGSFADRFMNVCFDNPEKAGIERRLRDILSAERRSCDDDTLNGIIEKHYPSIRSMIMHLQRKSAAVLVSNMTQ